MENDILESNLICKKTCYDSQDNWIIYMLIEFFYGDGYNEYVVYRRTDKKCRTLKRFEGRNMKKAADFFDNLK